MKKTNNITLAILADKLDVSTTTVSKALRGKAGIGPETAQRVQDLARELNYQPNFAAQSLKKNTSDSIGLLITNDITNPWYAQLVSSIESELSKRGKTMILSLDKDDYEKERNCLEAFRGGRVAGVIVGPIFRQRNLTNIWQSLNNGLPLVLFNCMDEMPVDYVAINQAKGAKIAVNHLIESGHKHIGYLCCPDSPQETGKTRREGFEQALFEHDIPLFGRDIIEGNVSRKGGYEAMKELLTQDKTKLPTAFFCHNDNVALGAMMAIQQAGLSVPEDISLIGFDDIEESSLAYPALTTIGGIKDRFAKELVETILTLAEHKAQTNTIKKEVTPKLIIRDTVRQNC